MSKLAQETTLMHKIKDLTFVINTATKELIYDIKRQEKHPTTHYIWRTRGDGKVRSRHEKFNGKKFAWDKPPEGGFHPGEDYGCRCTAEPYEPGAENLREQVSQIVTSSVNDIFPAWTIDDFGAYYFFGGGNALLLSDIGFLQKSIDHTKKIIFPRVENQIIAKARKNGEGTFPWNFYNRYNFKPVTYEFGDSVVSGKAEGGVTVIDKGGFLIIKADIHYKYSDVFTDVLDIGHAVNNIDKVINWLKKRSKPFVEKFIRKLPWGATRIYISLMINEKPLPEHIEKPDIGKYDIPLSTPYRIYDTWNTRIEAIVKK